MWLGVGHYIYGVPALMTSPLLAPPGPSAHDLQSHLYLAFLQGRTADVALRIRGSWNAVYSLHRVVLIQSVSAMNFRVPLGSLPPSRASSALCSRPASQSLFLAFIPIILGLTRLTSYSMIVTLLVQVSSLC